MEIEKILKDSFRMWNELTNTEKKTLIQSSFLTKHKKGNIIHEGTQNCLGLIVVIKGSLRAFLASDNGKEITLYKLYENDICLFTASCVMKDINFDINLECLDDTDILVIPVNKYKEILENSKLISNYISTILSSRFSEVMWILEQFVFYSLDKRVATYLLENEENNVLNVTHEKIASELGSAREVISRMLKYFEKENIISLGRNKITVINFEKLEDFSEK
ncbi:MAG: Crp/Fnr family transcriptional regulator [Bacilli bacterium]|nr:Crp/Fnr family transcriptional regulator [Bacilli bacterium]MDD4795590.1 Crp/Fnr family transcriptional regulator [Bacilli bacterium]